ncbi:FixH family protein [Undibacterium sp. Ren11W]|uniref:FixH family protein n=1 Tax=Undibacterium sp. Ren11W TaxID=3413045 RepID=UPI003BF44F23
MNSILLQQKTKKDIWYKEPWLLLVVGGPLIVVCASLFTGMIAFRGADKVVAEDYYKQGLMINKDIQRDARARALALSATITLDLAAGKLKMQLAANQTMPDTVQVSLASADKKTSSVTEVIRRLPMRQIQAGSYEGDLNLSSNLSIAAVKLLHVKVETTEWRLTGDWFEPEQRQAHLAAAK